MSGKTGETSVEHEKALPDEDIGNPATAMTAPHGADGDSPCEDDGDEDGFSFQTMPMETPGESADEKIGRILKILEELLTRSVDSDDTHALYEDMASFYNSFDSKVKALIEKLDKEVQYTRYIETQISSKSIEKECLMLKKALVEERALMGVKFDGILSSFDEKMRQIESVLKHGLEEQAAKLSDISKRVGELTSIDDKITGNLESYRKEMTKASTNEYNILQKQCREIVAENSAKVEAVKKNVLSFLKSCEKQNDDLIRKIPEQKRRFSWKDAVIYVMSGLCILGLIVQLFL